MTDHTSVDDDLPEPEPAAETSTGGALDGAVDGDVPELDGTPVGRRTVLAIGGLGVAGVLTGAALQERIADVLRPITNRDPTGLTALVPGADRFRIYTVTGDLPKKSRADWRLNISGLVDEPRTLRFADLLDLPSTSMTADFQCVTGWRVHDVHWKGVRLREILDAVGVKASATHLRFTSFDGAYSESLDMEQARRDDVLVAYEMIGGSITSEHGGPVRLFVAPMYGYKSCKWLDGIELTDTEVPGYWEERGYDVDAWVGRSNGRDDHPTSGS